MLPVVVTRACVCARHFVTFHRALQRLCAYGSDADASLPDYVRDSACRAQFRAQHSHAAWFVQDVETALHEVHRSAEHFMASCSLGACLAHGVRLHMCMHMQCMCVLQASSAPDWR